MFVIEVIPLIRGTKIDTLSYYSAVEYPIGTFLDIPIRDKEYKAIVTGVSPVTKNKNALKTASFTLRKLPGQVSKSTVPKNVKETAQSLTNSYPATLGSILYQLLPPDVRSGEYQYPLMSSLVHNEDTVPQILTSLIEDRYVSYRSHVRNVLARRGSVIFVVPSYAYLAYASKHLSQGIEDRVVIFSPQQTKYQQQKAYEAFEDTTIAKLIITTPSHAYLDRVDLLSIVIEKSASDAYRSQLRPYLDHRQALIAYATVSGRSVLLGDILPRTEEEYKRRQEVYSTYESAVKRLAFTSLLTIITQKDKSTPEKPFALISRELKARITNIMEKKGRVFLYGARRGLAPLVNCVDCGYIFRCPDSETPYSLVKTIDQNGKEIRWFVSSNSGKKIRAADTCPSCNSWRLRTRGIGVQQVFDNVSEHFNKNSVFLLDNITGRTRKRTEKIISDFYKNQSSILVGTQMCLPYLALAKVDLSAVVSLDAARSNPTWKADENIFKLLLELRELSNEEVMVQTRTETDTLLENAAQGSVEAFYSEELELRESLNYPPLSTFILLTWTGAKDVVQKIELLIKKIAGEYQADYYSNPNSNETKILRHALFRLPKESKTKANFISQINALPPYIRIEIDPGRIV